MIGEIVAKLGLRYPPSGQADLAAHAERIKLLAQDVADVPPDYLRAAVAKIVRESVFLPKAAELIAAAREIAKADRQGTDGALAQLQSHCDRVNGLGGSQGFWFVAGQAPHRRVELRKHSA